MWGVGCWSCGVVLFWLSGGGGGGGVGGGLCGGVGGCFGWGLPEGAGGGGEGGTGGVQVIMVHDGNLDLEGGDVGEEGPGGRRLLLPKLLPQQQRQELDLDHRAGETQHTPKGGDRQKD